MQENKQFNKLQDKNDSEKNKEDTKTTEINSLKPRDIKIYQDGDSEYSINNFSKHTNIHGSADDKVSNCHKIFQKTEFDHNQNEGEVDESYGHLNLLPEDSEITSSISSNESYQRMQDKIWNDTYILIDQF